MSSDCNCNSCCDAAMLQQCRRSDTSKAGMSGQVFVGSFRGRGPFGTKPAPRQHANAAAASVPGAVNEQDDSSGTESDTPAGDLQAFSASNKQCSASGATLQSGKSDL